MRKIKELRLKCWRINWAFAWIQYEVRATVEQWRIATGSNMEFYYSENGRRRLTSLEMGGRLARSTARNFSQAVLHACLGCREAIRAAWSYFSWFLESLSKRQIHTSRPAQESQAQQECKVSVLPYDKSKPSPTNESITK